MKATVPQPPKHTSYLKHRQQVVWQIILPIVLGALVLIGAAILLGMSAMQGQADLARMAAISVIWLIVPLMVLGVIVFIVLAVMAYLINRGAELIPNYTGRLQDFAYRLEGAVRRFTRAAVRPVTFLDDLTSRLKGYIGRR